MSSLPVMPAEPAQAVAPSAPEPAAASSVVAAPAVPTVVAPKVSVLGTDPAAFDQAVVGWGWPRFRGKQVRDWVYTKLADDPDRMTNLSKPDRDLLRERVDFASAEITRRQS